MSKQKQKPDISLATKTGHFNLLPTRFARGTLIDQVIFHISFDISQLVI